MPCLTVKFDPAIGPIIRVGVSPPGTYGKYKKVAMSGTAPRPAMYPFLIDTGADGTCISEEIATSLGLTPLGKKPISGFSGVASHNTYYVDICLMFGNEGLVMESLEVTEFPSKSSNYKGLLGRDLLCQGSFSLNFNGDLVFCL